MLRSWPPLFLLTLLAGCVTPIIAEEIRPPALTIKSHQECFGILCFSSDGKILVSGDLGGEFIVGNAGTEKKIRGVQGHARSVRCRLLPYAKTVTVAGANAALATPPL